jgi:hypothetical protein
VFFASRIIVLQSQLSLCISPRAGTRIWYSLSRYNLAGHPAATLGSARLVGQRLTDEGKIHPLGPGLLNSPVGQRQPLARPGIGRGVGWRTSCDAHPGAGQLVTRPAFHAFRISSQPAMVPLLSRPGQA